jgi:hypothetical protein
MTFVRKISTLLLVALAMPAAADEIVTLKVPVNLQNLHPEIASISVGCTIVPTSAYGRTDLPVSNRSFSGTVNVKVTVTDGQTASANGYRCQLALMPAGGSGWFPQQGTSGPPQAQAKPGTPFVTKVEGSFGPMKGFGPPSGGALTNLPPPIKKP